MGRLIVNNALIIVWRVIVLRTAQNAMQEHYIRDQTLVKNAHVMTDILMMEVVPSVKNVIHSAKLV